MSAVFFFFIQFAEFSDLLVGGCVRSSGMDVSMDVCMGVGLEK